MALRTLLVLLAATFVASVGSAAAADVVDCTGPAGDPAPDTPEWHAREAREASCGEQRAHDTAANPAFHAAALANTARDAGLYQGDPFRDPTGPAGARFRYETLTFPDPTGQQLEARLFRPPADRPPPYPAVIVVHGGSADQEMYDWGSEALAEAGYMVLTFQVPTAENTGPASFPGDTKAALDFLTSTRNPRLAELDRARIGLAGHSAGGFAVSQVGQEDKRVKAIVSWDRAQSSPMRAGLPLRTPALFMTADYNCQRVPVCVPQPYTAPPDPLGPGNKDEDFRRLRTARVDTMKVALRAATHLDFTQFGIAGTGSRYGAVVASYYTLAWFDRYLRDDRAALGRLTATVFDDSADVHNISGGTFDPLTQANVPAHIAGQPVADRLSFHFRSAYFLGHGARRCEDIRAGCGR
jgi:dienelactone hydrolase